MSIYFSAATCSFYDSSINVSIPSDAVEIATAEHAALLQGQLNGQQISCDAVGKPVLIEPLVDNSPEHCAAVIANRRFLAESTGVVVNDLSIPTDRDSQSLITAAALAAMLDSTYRCQWKTANGFIELDAEQILALAKAVRAHVQACFDREAELLTAVQNGTYEPSMLDQGWPA